MEIEMEKFETDMDNTWMKEASRTGAVIVRSPAAEKNAEGPGSAPRKRMKARAVRRRRKRMKARATRRRRKRMKARQRAAQLMAALFAAGQAVVGFCAGIAVSAGLLRLLRRLGSSHGWLRLPGRHRRSLV